MKPGDIYRGIRDGEAIELEIQEGPFRVTHAQHPVQQVRLKILSGSQEGELHQWGVGYIESFAELVEK